LPIRIYRLHQSLRDDGWDALLKVWGHYLDTWCRLASDDVPYWYGERALTGALAAAAWSMRGACSLVEIATGRGATPNSNTRRLDAWIVLRGVFYQIETKQAWVYDQGKTATAKAIGETSRCLRLAARQIRTLPGEYQGDAALALCFALHGPAWPTDASPRPGLSILQGVAERCAEPEEYAISVLYAPPRRQYPVYRERGDVRRCYPGCVLVGQQIWLAPGVAPEATGGIAKSPADGVLRRHHGLVTRASAP
jgi:hypothetical protein